MGFKTAVELGKKLFSLGILTAIFCMMLSQSCSAGGLNTSEQSVVAAARGTFEWEGHTYRAKQNYIDSLIVYLSRDDVELGEADCQNAIQKMYENIKRGVLEGYLERTDNQSENAAAESEHRFAETETGNQSTGKEYEDYIASLYLEGEEVVEPAETTPVTYGGYSATMREGRRLLKNTPNHDEQRPEVRRRIPYAEIEIAALILCGFLLLSLLIIGQRLWNKRKRFHIPKMINCFLFASSSFGWIVIMGILSAFFSGLQRESAINFLGKTNFYENIYQTLQADQNNIAILIDRPDLFTEDESLRGKVIIQAHRQTRDALNQIHSVPDYGVLFNDLEDVVRENAGEEAASVLSSYLERKYARLLVWDGVPWWIQEIRHFGDFVKKISVPIIILLLSSNILFMLFHSRKYRGMRSCAYSLACSSLLFILGSAVLWMFIKFGAFSGKLTVSEEFSCLYLQNLSLIGIMAGCTGICISIGMLEAVRHIKRSK